MIGLVAKESWEKEDRREDDVTGKSTQVTQTLERTHQNELKGLHVLKEKSSHANTFQQFPCADRLNGFYCNNNIKLFVAFSWDNAYILRARIFLNYVML